MLFGNSSKPEPQQSSYNRNERPGREERPASSQRSSALHRKVVDSAYIGNLRLGRSWVLPQMVAMGFDYQGNFSEQKYFAAINDLGYNKCWEIMMRNFRQIKDLRMKDPAASAARANWWTKEVALAMANFDVMRYDQEVKFLSAYPKTHCSGGPFIFLNFLRGRKGYHNRLFFLNPPLPGTYWNSSNSMTVADLRAQFVQRIRAIEMAYDPASLYQALKAYDDNRCVMQSDALPEAFVSAYAGDGAYNAMMTMVKYLGLNHTGSRDSSIADIELKAREYAGDGRRMLVYCAQRYFNKANGGMFDLNAYRNRR